jgi:hypothetical protein
VSDDEDEGENGRPILVNLEIQRGDMETTRTFVNDEVGLKRDITLSEGHL